MRELRNIVIFAEVAACQSISKAAKNLLLTPSAVSMGVQKLESALGTRLLTRTTRQLYLTADGRAFFEHAQEGLNKIYEAIDLFEDREASPSGPLRVSIVSTIGRHLILPVLTEFMTQYPAITLDISLNDQMPDLVRDRFDLGLCYGAPDESSYVGRYLCAPSTVLVASPSYLALHGRPAHPHDLSSHKIVNVRLRDGLEPSWTISERIAGAGTPSEPMTILPKSSINIIENHDSALDAAIAGLGIALVLKQSATAHLKVGSLDLLLPAYDSRLTHGSKVFLLYPTKKYLPARARAFIDFLVNVSRREDWSGAAVPQPAPAQEKQVRTQKKAASRLDATLSRLADQRGVNPSKSVSANPLATV
jgi:DNA-binding transcriptional LysR family regulator